MMWLAQVKLEDVFKSTQQNLDAAPSSQRMAALVLGVIAVGVLLLVLHLRGRQAAVPRTLNNPGRLLREAAKATSLRSAELRELRQLAGQQSCQSPLTLLLCPSVLGKALAGRPASSQKALERVARKALEEMPR